MGVLQRLGIKFVYRKCPYGRIHNVNKNEGSCGHGGIVLDWCEAYHKWIPNPTKTVVAKEMIEEDDEFAIDKEARDRLIEDLDSGNIKPVEDFRKKIMKKL